MILERLNRLMLAHRGVRYGLWIIALMVSPIQSAIGQVPRGPTQNVLAGSRIFGTRGCVRCHAINGLGGTTGPDLGQSRARQSFYDFAAAMWNHLPNMVGQMEALGIQRPHLDPWEAGDLIAFLFWLDYFDLPGDTARGRELFTSKSCITCHQVQGVGGVVGPNLDFIQQYGSPIEVAAAMWNHGPTMSATMGATGMRRPTFTGAELTDLIAFLKKSGAGRLPDSPVYILPGRADAGRRRFVERRCIVCHRVGGEGGTLGPNLVQAERGRSVIEFAAAMWNKAPSMTATMQARGISVPQLEAEDMADIVAYLYSVRYFGTSGSVQRGRGLLRRKDCLTCHSLAGRGGRTAPDLRTVTRLGDATAVTAAMWNHVLVPNDSVGGQESSWPTIDGGEMADLGAFFQSLARGR